MSMESLMTLASNPPSRADLEGIPDAVAKVMAIAEGLGSPDDEATRSAIEALVLVCRVTVHAPVGAMLRRFS